MTLYGTPGGQPQNTPGFQGTAPGLPGAPIVAVNPGVGFFPPNSNNFSGDTIQAAQARAVVPANALATNAGRHAAGGRTVLEAESMGGARGYNGSAGGYDSLNSDANGGAGPGAGQQNQTEGPSAGEASTVEGAAPAASITFGTVGFGG